MVLAVTGAFVVVELLRVVAEVELARVVVDGGLLDVAGEAGRLG